MLAVGLVRQRNNICYYSSNAPVTVQVTLAAPPRARRTNGAHRKVRRS
jgi:hypothetical protein